MPHTSRFTMIPLAVLSVLFLMPQVTIASSLSQKQYQQQYQQALTCSNFVLILPESETGFAGPAFVFINSANSSKPVNVMIITPRGASGITITSKQTATYTGGVLIFLGASNTFTFSVPAFPSGFIPVTPTPRNSVIPGTPFNVHALCFSTSQATSTSTGSGSITTKP